MSQQIEDNYIHLLNLARKHAPEYEALLMSLANDRNTNNGNGMGKYLGLKRAPAATRRHHAYEGGLLVHFLEMWDLYQTLRETMTEGITAWSDQELDTRVFRGIINHDLHKAYEYYELVAVAPWETKYAQSDTKVLLTDNHTTLYLLSQHNIKLDIVDRNVVLNSEGGWCEIETKERTSLATLVYCLDELSGNVMARLKEGTHYRQNIYNDKRMEPALVPRLI